MDSKKDRHLRPWRMIADEAGVLADIYDAALAEGDAWLTPDLRRACVLLRDLGVHYGLSKAQRRTFLMLLMNEPTHIDAIETVMALSDIADTPMRTARVGISFLDEMLNEYHAKHLAVPLRRLVARDLDASEIADSLNDAGFDERVNGHQPHGEWHVRKACKKLGLKPRAVRWR